MAAFPTFRSRGAIRELGKVLGLPPGELERVARGAEPFAVRGAAADVETGLGLEPGGPPAPFVDMDNRAPFAMSTGEWLAMVNGHDPADIVYAEPPPRISEERYAGLPGRWEWLARLCDEAYGLPRHLSQHSGGMIVSTRPLIDCCPVLPAAMEGRQLCQWDKDSCADAGFLKIDLLGLGMLSAVERCVELIERERGERIDLSRIPFDDAETYAAIQTADTMGVFQIESRAQMQSLYRTRPETLDDLTIQVAIVRPGPILGGAVNPYIARRQRMREDPDFVVPYDHPSLEPVLRDTLGTIIFQDQVIEVAMAFAGFAPGEAEGLRRAMSRKRSAAAIEAYHQRFLDGAMATHGVDVRDGRARLHDDRRLLRLRLPEGPRSRLRAARLPVDVAARAPRARVPVRAAQRAADGLLRAGHAVPRGAAQGDRARGARRQRQRRRVHGGDDRPARARADRARLRARRAARRGRGAGRRPPGRRPVPLARRPRLARRRGPPGAREARLGGSLRRARHPRGLVPAHHPRSVAAPAAPPTPRGRRPTPRSRPVVSATLVALPCGSWASLRPASGWRTGRSWRCRWRCRRRQS